MGTPDQTRLYEVLRMAREIASQLAPLTGDANALPLRLAQAHALGLIDQIAEMVPSDEAVTRSNAQPVSTGAFEDELIHA